MLTVLYSYYPTFDHFVSNARRHFVFQVDFFDPTFDSDMIFGGCGALIFVIDAQVCNFTRVLRTALQSWCYSNIFVIDAQVCDFTGVLRTVLQSWCYSNILFIDAQVCDFTGVYTQLFHNVVIQTFLSRTLRCAISLAKDVTFYALWITTFYSNMVTWREQRFLVKKIYVRSFGAFQYSGDPKTGHVRFLNGV